MLTAYEMVLQSAARSPAHPALVDPASGTTLTYQALIAEVDSIAAGLAKRGVRAGDRIATVLPNGLAHCLALLALARLNAVPALLNARLKPAEIAALIGQGEMAGAIVAPPPGIAEAVRAALPEDGLLLVVGGAGDDSFEACRGEPDVLPAYARPGAADPAFVFYTSGTTGLPKGAVVPHRASEPRALFLCSQAGLRHGSHNRMIGIMPLAHCIGFYAVFLAALALNGTYYAVAAFDPAQAVSLIERERISSIFASPTHFHALMRAPNFSPRAVASVEHLMHGGAPISEALLSALDKAFAGTVRHIYGTTETMNSLYNPAPAGNARLLRPGYWSRVRVVRPNGGVDDEVAVGEEGELIVDASADATFSGYLNRPDATAKALVDGWYRTGDAALRLASGDLILQGRVDDRINSGAEHIHPEEVEGALASHPAVADAAVVGTPDARWGEAVVACVVARGEADWRALDAHLKAGDLAAYKRPRGYLFLDALPRNAANKVLRRELKERVAAARAGTGGTIYYDRDAG